MAKAAIENTNKPENGGAETPAPPPSSQYKYIGPKPAARIGNLPGVFGTKAADELTQEEIAFVLATASVDKVKTWWTTEPSTLISENGTNGT